MQECFPARGPSACSHSPRSPVRLVLLACVVDHKDYMGDMSAVDAFLLQMNTPLQ